jgi:hypothetical protein|tara:strand:- start:33 stop:257 length:225 start_codon:yes stop_codon:yes gene_type:complete
MSEDFKIEKDIPIHNYSKKAQYDDLISRMEVGDSVLLTSYTDIEQIRQAANRANKKVTSRIAKGEYGHRVWRTK